MSHQTTHFVGCWRIHLACCVRFLEDAIALLSYGGAASGEHEEAMERFIAATVARSDS